MTLAEKVRALLLAAGYLENERIYPTGDSGGFELWEAPEHVTLLHVMPGGMDRQTWNEQMLEYQDILEPHFTMKRESYMLDIREKSV